MSEPQAGRTTTFGFPDSLWRASARILLVSGVAAALISPLSWFTGGFRSQLQVDVEELRKAVADDRSRTAVLASRLDSLAATIPRQSDMAGWEAHLSRLDAVFDSLRDSLAQDRISNHETAVRVQQLTTVPLRPGR